MGYVLYKINLAVSKSLLFGTSSNWIKRDKCWHWSKFNALATSMSHDYHCNQTIESAIISTQLMYLLLRECVKYWFPFSEENVKTQSRKWFIWQKWLFPIILILDFNLPILFCWMLRLISQKSGHFEFSDSLTFHRPEHNLKPAIIL